MAASSARRRGIIAEINVTPLVDIMLVLLIIFMLTAHLLNKQAIEVELPRATQSSALPPTTLAITLKADGAIYLNDRPVTPAALRDAIRAQVARDPKTQAIVAGDRKVSHGRVVWVLDTVKALGITQFAIQIDPQAIVPPLPPGDGSGDGA
ncbi:MAG TPA: biopolymer transporter ExbD [Kofleriaceae bacterium]|nr:biopolymer transporter ExbD [Kofleriaceae bacterium]